MDKEKMIYEFKEYVSMNCSRDTKERLIVFLSVMKQDTEFCVLDIYYELMDDKDLEPVALATVYNTFTILESGGFITQTKFKDRRVFYDLNRSYLE